MAGNKEIFTFDERVMAPQLSENEIALRNLFVAEYLKDFDETSAAMRVGFQFSFAREYGTRFLQEPYVQQRIAELTRETPKNKEQQELEDKALILSVLRQAAQNGPYASRVLAASKLATILGMDKPPEDTSKETELIQMFKDFAAKAPV